ncbi:hypothetical protein BDF14DRAFT_1736166 [Spinellus fusiger]|nr:hypothetical protein BDF14DRAFT_1736166 [Spinellus fusiger]
MYWLNHKANVDIIIERGYNIKFMPPYSLMFNPTDKFLSDLKENICTDLLCVEEDILDRVHKYASKITQEDCQKYIAYSIDFYDLYSRTICP